MTIAVFVKVNNGLVVASDSATTIGYKTPQENIYNHENKIFNLRKGLPIFGMTCGNGNIGHASISSLAKDLRQRFTDGYSGADGQNWQLGDGFSIENVAVLARKFLFEEKYLAIHPQGFPDYYMQFFVGGYSHGSELPEVWEVSISGNASPPPKCIADKDSFGIFWAGQLEAINRLVGGIGSGLTEALIEIGVQPNEVDQVILKIHEKCRFELSSPAMPIQDAIELSVYLVETSIGFCRFNPGSKVVGGPVEVAAITKHEDFKWVKRKHYFNRELNPGNTAGGVHVQH